MTEVAVSKTPEPSTDERAATGLQELDGMLEGGFLSGSLVTLTGRPGTGKTIFGLHFESLMAQKRFSFLELPAPTSEGLPALWEQIAREIDENDTERLVIDSFTAMSPAFQTVEEFVADGVIKFSIVPAGEARVRYIEITKMRGTNHQMGPIPIDIGPRGIRIVHPHVRGNPV